MQVSKKVLDMFQHWTEEAHDAAQDIDTRMAYFKTVALNDISVDPAELDRIRGTKSPKLCLHFHDPDRKGRISIMPVTKLLKKLNPEAQDHIVRDHASRIVAELMVESWEVRTFHATDTGEEERVGKEMAQVYEDCDFGSCMRLKGGISGNVYIYEGLSRHPIEIYATPDIALIAIFDTEEQVYKARAIVNQPDKKFFKLYPADRTGINEIWVNRLTKWLEDQGYERTSSSLAGCRVRNIQVIVRGSIYTLIPYIDVEGCVGVRETKTAQYTTLTPISKLDSDASSISLAQTNGFGKWAKGGYQCHSCGEMIQPGEHNYAGLNGQEIICNHCREENYYFVEGPDVYVHGEDCFTCDYCGSQRLNDDHHEYRTVTDMWASICTSCIDGPASEDVIYSAEHNRYYERLHPDVGGPRIESNGQHDVNYFLSRAAHRYGNRAGREVLLAAQEVGATEVELSSNEYLPAGRPIPFGLFKFTEEGAWVLDSITRVPQPEPERIREQPDTIANHQWVSATTTSSTGAEYYVTNDPLRFVYDGLLEETAEAPEEQDPRPDYAVDQIREGREALTTRVTELEEITNRPTSLGLVAHLLTGEDND